MAGGKVVAATRTFGMRTARRIIPIPPAESWDVHQKVRPTECKMERNVIVPKNRAFCSEIERSIDRLLSLPNVCPLASCGERQSSPDGLPEMQAPLYHPLPPSA